MVDGEFGKLYRDWVVLSEKYVKNNPIYVQLLMHTTIGQLYKYISIPFSNENNVGIELDGRVHIFDIEHQASGKNRIFAMLNKICSSITYTLQANHVNITFKYDTCESSTDAGLIGTYEDQPVQDATGRPTGERTRVLIPGKLNGTATNYAIVSMQEASTLFNSSNPTFRQESLTYFNECMNSIHSGLNIIRKRLARDEIECHGEVSLVLTTFPTRKIKIEDLNIGIFRRLFVHYNDKSLDEAYSSTIEVWNKQGSEEKTDVVIGRIVAVLCKNIHNYETKEQGRITFNDSVRKFVQDWLRERNRISKEQLLIGVDTSKLHLMRAFEATYAEKMLVIASHRAIIENRHSISLEDVKYASVLINKLLDEVRNFIFFVYNMNTHEGISEEGDMRSIVLRMIVGSKEGTIKLKQLVTQIVSSYNERSPTKRRSIENKVRYQIEKLKKENIIKVGSDGGISLLVSALKEPDGVNTVPEI